MARQKSRRSWTTLLASLLLVLISLQSCTIFEARRDIQKLDTLGRIKGSVRAAESPEISIIVALVRYDGDAQTIANYYFTSSGSDYLFLVPPGSYGIIAFGDTNNNQSYDPGELLSNTAPFPVEVTSGEQLTLDQLNLRGGLKPGFEYKELAQSAAKALSSRKTHFGEIASLEETDFDRTHALQGLWEPYRSLMQVKSGLFFLEAPDPRKIPVVFVHGAMGTPRDFKAIIDQLDRSVWQPWVFYYPSGLKLDLAARYLQQAMEHARHKVGFSKYILVAHSMGGLVARRYLGLAAKEHNLPFPRRFITFSTPWAGHASAALGVEYAPVVIPSWTDMAPSSQFLAELFSENALCGVPHTLLFGFRAKGATLSENSDGVVTLASMLRPEAQRCAQRLVGFNASHVEILSDASAIETFNKTLEETAEEPL